MFQILFKEKGSHKKYRVLYGKTFCTREEAEELYNKLDLGNLPIYQSKIVEIDLPTGL